MNPNKIDIEIRNRTNWEAFDLGKPIVFKYFKPVYLPWLTANLLIVLASSWLFFVNPVFAFFVIWLFLPLAERTVLFVLSRAVFGDVPSYKETMKQWIPQLKNGVFSFNFAWRFLPNRSFVMPVWQLEGLTGSRRRKRLQQISHNASNTAVMEGSIFASIEHLLAMSFIAFVLFLIPEGIIIWDEVVVDALFETLPAWVGVIGSIVYLLAIVLIRPIYVAGGFTLYLHRRMVLEGWDIELQFRSLNQRLKKGAFTLIMLLGFLFLPSSARAESDAKERINEILSQEEFNTKKEVKFREFKDSKKESTNLDFLTVLAGLLKVLFILLIIGIFVWLIYKICKSSNSIRIAPKASESETFTSVKEVMGMSITKESLPSDLPKVVNELIAEGKYRETLSLLYRGSLSNLVQLYRITLQASSTEGECLRAFNTHANTSQKAYFEKLTNAWVSLAYAHQNPNAEDLRQFSTEWASLFMTKASTKEGGTDVEA
ncbi:MAG: hypothetical protein NE330_22790 [Lentisphaeraceae bacterium]|nr:hypothetical protein [Lentisphaeraceae bacterium]